MKVKKMAIATLVGGFGMWVIAGLWHNLIMPSLYESIDADHEGIGILLLSYFILALLMSYIYPLGYKGGSPLWEGLRFGMVIGILWVFPHELAMAGAHGEPLGYAFQNGLWHMVEQGLGGMMIGAIFGNRQMDA